MNRSSPSRVAVAPAIAVFLLAALVQTTPLTFAQDAATHTVTGIVVDDEGAPIAGASVYGYTRGNGSDSYGKDLSGTDGSFTLHLAAGEGYVEASHESHRPASVQLVVDGDEDVRLVLASPPPRTAVVEGRVLDPNGEPVEGAQVTIGQGCCYAMETSVAPTPPASDGGGSDAEMGASSGSAGMASPSRVRPDVWYEGDHQSVETGPDGTYRFTTYPGPRQVTATAKGYAQTQVTVEARADDTVEADLRLEKVPDADAVLVVRVTDASTGAPLGGAHVSLQNAEWSRYEWAETGADGVARLTTLPGWSIVSVQWYGGGPVAVAEGEAFLVDPVRAPGTQYYALTKAFRLESGERTLDAKLEPKASPSVVLTGYVVDPGAKAGVPDAQVSVWNQDTGEWGSATTDATGSYKIIVRPGHYTLNVWANGHLPGATTFTIGDDEAAKRVDVEAPRGEQRYAPCMDDCARPMVMMAEDDAAKSAPALATTGEAQTREAEGASAGGDSTRASAYQGSGGGLPPYDAEAAPLATGSDEGARAEVPAVGVGAALVLLGLLAVARRR